MVYYTFCRSTQLNLIKMQILLDPKKGKKMKANYVNPEIELILLYKSDIIVTSGGSDNDIDEDLGENDGEWT